MAYAAYKEFTKPMAAPLPQVFEVLDITVPLTDAFAVRRALRACDGVDVLRCEPLLHAGAACSTSAPRARLTLHLAASNFDDVSRCVLERTLDGEIGCVTSWRRHLRRVGLAHGG